MGASAARTQHHSCGQTKPTNKSEARGETDTPMNKELMKAKHSQFLDPSEKGERNTLQILVMLNRHDIKMCYSPTMYHHVHA